MKVKGQITKVVVILSIVLFAGCSTVNNSLMKRGYTVSERRFTTEIAAVIDASLRHHAESVSQNKEFGGGIIMGADGKYLYTISEGVRDQEKLKIRFLLNKGEKLVAFWHTHGGGRPWREYFSGEDIKMTNETGFPLYLLTPKRHLKILKPGDKKFNQLSIRQSGWPSGEDFAPGKTLMKLN